MKTEYFDHVKRVRFLADSLGLRIVPTLFAIGRSNSLMALDPNLAEGLPVVDAPFVVKQGVAVPMTDPPVLLSDKPRWVDPGVRVDGRHATIENNLWRARWIYDLDVHPWRVYRVSVWIRTENYRGRPLVRVLDAAKHPLCLFERLPVERTQDWTRHDIVFHTFDNAKVALYFGVWRRARGRVEFRDWTIEECGPVNLVRRAGLPFIVRGQDGTVYQEGVDYEPVSDRLMGNAPWPGEYDLWHEPPQVLTRLPDGTRLSLSWHQAGVVNAGEVTCCLSDTGTYSRFADESRRVRELFGSEGYMMQIDESRVMNQDSLCRKRSLDAGSLLADAARRCTSMLAGSRVYVWNDMFDPYHNAVDHYALVRGDLAGAWEGLSPEVCVVNWNGGKQAEKSLRFFAGRGHKQILAGYYDGEPDAISRWLRVARNIPGIEGVMYTTWRNDYDRLEDFAQAAGVKPVGPRLPS
jgi:hypothetical protein